MDEKDTATPSPQPVQARPMTDVDAFFRLLPDAVRSFASKDGNPKTVTDLAIDLARKTTGQLVQAGIVVHTMYCRDELPLGIPTSEPIASAQGSVLGQGHLGAGRNRQGQAVAHFPSSEVTKIQGL